MSIRYREYWREYYSGMDAHGVAVELADAENDVHWAPRSRLEQARLNVLRELNSREE